MRQAFQDRDALYLVMDLMPGGDLRYHICRKHRFNEQQTRFFAACIFLSLEYMHSQKIIHRDIKPENIVFDSKGTKNLTQVTSTLLIWVLLNNFVRKTQLIQVVLLVIWHPKSWPNRITVMRSITTLWGWLCSNWWWEGDPTLAEIEDLLRSKFLPSRLSSRKAKFLKDGPFKLLISSIN